MKKLSNRLQKIDCIINANYQSIWDCCCDHGLLGLTLLKRKAATTIHFVDIVPSLTAHLESLLQKHFSNDQYLNCWQVHCLDVGKLPITAQDKQLIIIAGVGGELLIQLIENLISKLNHISLINQINEVEFILCPVHHNYQVRQALINHQCTLLGEYIVTENKRFYEVIHVKKQLLGTTSKDKILNEVHPTGYAMWDLSIQSHRQYLTETIHHYQRMLLSAKSNDQVNINHIIEQYSALTSKALD
jgi:tRNA (adenine22-N1)-methyltransferase